MKPLYDISNRKFIYTPACATDIATTFRKRAARMNRAWDEAHAEKAQREAKTTNVSNLRRKK